MNVDFHDIETFVRQHYPEARKWNRLRTVGWFQWHMEMRYLFLCYNGVGQVMGVAIVRPMATISDKIKDLETETDEKGFVAYVDLCVASCTEALRGMMRMVLERYGGKIAIAFHRKGKLHAHGFDRLASAILRGT